MVGFDRKRRLTKTQYAIAGAGSGLVTRLVCQPFDVIKIRFQLQVEPITLDPRYGSKYRSMSQALLLMLREEGIKALWKGHIPGQLLSITYGLAQFTSFEYLTEWSDYLFRPSNAWLPMVHFVCGSASGSIATVASYPFDTVRTRLVAQSEQKRIYKSFFNALLQLPRQEGPTVLYRGLVPTLIQIGPHTGLQFMCFKIFDKLIKIFKATESSTFLASLTAGSLAGLIAKVVVYPLDLTKRRMQVQGFEEGRKIFGALFTCKGMFNCLIRIYQVEGFQGYYKGLVPSLMKAVVTTGFYFSSYETICVLMEQFKDKN